MTILASTSDVLRIVTGSAVSNIEAQASWVDVASGSYTPGSTETEITSNTTSTVVAAPASSTYRKINGLTVRNNSTSSCQVTVQHYNGSIAADLMGVTLLAGETLTKSQDGKWKHSTAAGGEYEWSRPRKGILGISGSWAETLPRELCPEANVAPLVSGSLYLTGIYLVAGSVVNSISFLSSTTAAGTPTNQFFALYSRSGALLAQSANDTTNAWAANTIKTLNMTAPYTVPVSGWYFVAIMITAQTMPTLRGVTTNTPGITASSVLPMARGTGSSSLTTVLPPQTAGIPGSSSRLVWACVS